MGKSSSKLKKRRTQSVAWSFRFKQPTVSNNDQTNAELKGRRFRKRHQKIEELNVEGDMTPVIICSGPHLDIQEWLKRLDLQQYRDKFEKFYGVEELIYFTEGDIHKLGVKNAAHRARMVSSLVALRSKRDKQNNNNTNVVTENKFQQMRNQRHSLAPEIARQKDHQEERDSIYEVLAVKSTSKTSKSVNDLLEMEPTTPDPEQAALKKALEWELSLDSRDIRSCAWYHGPIPRHRAEEIVEKEGDFLIRDCTSQPGNYVLTCRNVAKGPVLHFVISKLILQPDTVYERVQFQLEDDPFDTISDLVTYYVGSGKPISAASGARIQTPCNRLYPLSYYTVKYDRGSSIRGPSPMSSSASVNQMSTYRSPMSSPPPRTKRDVPPRLPSKKQRSQSLTPLQPSSVQNMVAGRVLNVSQDKYCSADGVIQGNETQAGSSSNKMTKSEQQKLSTQSLSRTISAQAIRTYRLHSRTSSLSRDYSDSSLSPCLESRQFGENEENHVPSPPPKPSRTSSLTRNGDGEKSEDVARANGDPAYRANGSDSGNGSGDSAQSSAAGEEPSIPLRSGVIIRNPRYLQNSASSVTLRSYADFDPEAVEKALLALQPIVYKNETSFDLDAFQTVLLPFVEHKPLDSSSLNTIRMMLCENGSLIIATHLTKVDIKMILGDVIDPSTPKSEEIESRKYSGLELITLDEGKAFRVDLIERTQCLKLLVATTILTCTDDIERAETINKWIQIANDTKTALGNLFGFSAIMLGLSMPQVQNLDNTWHILRQKFTESAFNFEAKLRPTLKSMNDCSNPQAPNTTVPHLLPYILLKDRKLQDIIGPNTTQLPSLVNCCINSWETTAEDFGLTTMFAHLDSARTFINNLPLYKKNAQIAMSDTSRADALLEEVFRTEFHIKFLWGSRGSSVAAIDRHTKFEQVLSAMAEKFCQNNTQEN
ncbi:breast cancer anti-estrogen resistance protein 3 homolog [Culicoides brevitarsis]|uniref:breast cancer anti-estrogen resistance protein 3 homolog n=1 Tax=Culicoides brevitarsis TaxID=469753 RepID=UPI00307B77ED